MIKENEMPWYGTKLQYLAKFPKGTDRPTYVTDLETTSITSENMELALTTNAIFYKNGDTFICSDNGTYKQGHIYTLQDGKWVEIGSQLYVHILNIGIDNGSYTCKVLNNSSKEITASTLAQSLEEGISLRCSNLILGGTPYHTYSTCYSNSELYLIVTDVSDSTASFQPMHISPTETLTILDTISKY